MSVFISWSGVDSKSHSIAKLLRDWLPKVIQRLDCFLSSKDIDAGAVWFDTLRQNLEQSKIGILCLTPESILRPWILFEAGVIARSFEQNRIYPLLIGLNVSEIPSPLAIFQGGSLSQPEMLKMVRMINDNAGAKALDSLALEDSFNLRWPAFYKELQALLRRNEASPVAKPKSGDTAAIEEVLKLVRGIASGNIPVTQRVSHVATTQMEDTPFEEDETTEFENDEARSYFQKMSHLVASRRPLAVGWVESVAYVSIDGKVMVWEFLNKDSFSLDSLNRPAQKAFLQTLCVELGLERLELRLVNSTKW